jgi:hypothetical protein
MTMIVNGKRAGIVIVLWLECHVIDLESWCQYMYYPK